MNQSSEFSIGRKIRTLRKAQNLTQEELAFKSAISKKYLSQIETDEREASIYVYKCVAMAMNVPMWRIFCDLSEDVLLTLHHFADCTEKEIRVLGQFLDGNKHALRQCNALDLGSRLAKDSC